MDSEEIVKATDKMLKKFDHWFENEWRPHFKCPECGEASLDLSKPRLGHPVICLNCQTMFDLKVYRHGND